MGANTHERMSDPRKETQFLECLYRHRNKCTDFTSAQLALIARVTGAEMHESNGEDYVLKVRSKKRKHGI